MGTFIKFAVPFVVLGGVGIAATGGNPMGMVKKQVGKVKSMVTRMELNRFADRLITDYETEGMVPPIENPAGFREWVATNFKSQGGRDPSMDYWHNDYEAVVVDDGLIVLISRGPNGIPDNGCADGVAPGLEDLIMGDAEAADQEIAPELEGSVYADDDVCVEVTLRQ